MLEVKPGTVVVAARTLAEKLLARTLRKLGPLMQWRLKAEVASRVSVGDVEDPVEESALLAVHVIGKDHELSDVAEDRLGL